MKKVPKLHILILLNCCKFIQGSILVIYGIYIGLQLKEFSTILDIIDFSEFFGLNDLIITIFFLFLYVAFGIYIKAIRVISKE